MFYYIKGECTHLAPDFAVVDCHGVGYKLYTSLTTMSKLSVGSLATLYTYLHIREDMMDLYGFADTDELNCFKLLLSVSGVGPKVALSLLCGLSPSQFALSVVSGDAKTLSKAQGVGPKMAQRIILELKDKMKKQGLAMDSGADAEMLSYADEATEALSALMVLGYSKQEAAFALKKVDTNLPLEVMIKEALKQLMRQG